MPGKTAKQVLKHIVVEFGKIKTALEKLKAKAKGKKAKAAFKAKIRKVDEVKKRTVALCRGTTRKAFS
jgi:hypothetical protein